jgi:murein L,D-transpeptidase YcbB/YkuD
MYFILNIKSVILNRILLSFFLLGGIISNGYAQKDTVKKDTIIQKFYSVNKEPLYWFSSDKSRSRATEWLTMLESAENLGVVLDHYQTNQVHVALLSNNTLDNINKEQRDKQITGLVLNFLKILQEGNIKFDYDEVNVSRDSVYINQLLNSKSSESVSQMVSRLDCKDHDYIILKKFLKDSITSKDTLKFKEIVLAMNYRRYFSANHPSEYIVANIPATEASYYQNDFIKLNMRTVVGRKKNPTPLIASYITNIVTFPHWNVPHSIAVKEILPRVQKNENYLEQHSYEVVNSRGKVLDDSELKWKNYTEKNFPYFFRQATGPRNALGVLKFNFQNPFSIFLHSTGMKSAFSKDDRFLSHGCIRLAMPLELAKILLPDKIDISELKSGKKNKKSKTIVLPHKIPVFIVYVPVTVVENKVTFLKDEYGLIN